MTTTWNATDQRTGRTDWGVCWLAKSIGAVAGILVSSATPAHGQAGQYTVTNLGMPVGASNAVGERMNSLGHVAGWSIYSSAPTLRAWVWTPAIGFTVLPPPPGMPSGRSRAMDINDGGVVCGDGGGFSGMAWRYENNVYTNVGAVGGMSIGILGGINNAGDIAGFATDQSIITDDLAFMDFMGGATINLIPSGARATDVNGAQQVVGYTQGSATPFEAFRWDTMSGVQLLGSLGLGHSFGNAISSAGHVVGEALSLTGDISMPWVWADGVGMQQIPALVTQSSVATGVNVQGNVVGTTRPPGQGPDIPWLWTGGDVVIDLNTLYSPGAEQFNALAAHDVNDAGQILAFGFDNSAVGFGTVLLTPAQGHAVPALPQWGMIAMTLLFLSGGALALRRRSFMAQNR